MKKFPTRRSLTRLLTWGLGPCWLLACGGSSNLQKQLDARWQWDGGVEASRVIGALKDQEIKAAVPAAVGVTGRGLVGRTLPDGKVWKYEGEVDVLPTLVGDAALFTGGGRVTMIDLSTGEVRFSVDAAGRRLEGAGYNGREAALLLVDKDNARKDQIRVLGSQGETLFSTTALARLGTPAVVGGVGLIPYSGQYVAGFDLKTGKLVGRVLFRDGLHTVKTDQSRLIMLGAGATLLDSKVTSEPKSESLKLKARELPGEPVWPRDGSQPRPARAEPVSLFAEPTQKEGSLQFAAGAYAASYFEIVTGFDHGSNRVRWTTHFDHSVAGGDTSPESTTVCLDDGSLWQLSWRDGSKRPAGSLESRLKACVVTALDQPVASGQRSSLLEQIQETIAGTGPDMVAMQRILLDELATQDSSATTDALLAIAQNPLVSSDLAKRAAGLLTKRGKGGQEMVEALIRSTPEPPTPPKKGDKAGDKPASDPALNSASNEVKEQEQSKKGKIDPLAAKRPNLRPPPVGALAQALVRLKPEGAAAALAPYLTSPSLKSSELKHVMQALVALGDKDQVEQVEAFLMAYKNTGGEPALLDALVMAAQFVLSHGSEDQRARLEKALKHSLTYPELKARTETLGRGARGSESAEDAAAGSEKLGPERVTEGEP